MPEKIEHHHEKMREVKLADGVWRSIYVKKNKVDEKIQFSTSRKALDSWIYT